MGDITRMFNPKTIAVIGATDREESFGGFIMKNLLRSPEQRRIYPVNPQKTSVMDIPSYPDILNLPEHIDLAIIATPAPTVPKLTQDCIDAGVEGAIIISSGFREAGPDGEKLEKTIADIRKRSGMRIMGPNCIGFMRPHIGLNTAPLKANPSKGNVAFITQSGAFGRVLLDWGIDKNLGFSMVASLGSMIDIDFGELIDFLGYDPHTKSIMVYMEENIGDVKKFISASRGFARNKPIIVLKPGRIKDGSSYSQSHTGHLATSDRVYDAVFQRLGVVRVKTAADLFNTVGVLHSKHLPKGPGLIVITNAYGVGVMAVNAMQERGGSIAGLSAESLEKIAGLVRLRGNGNEPIDVLRDADVSRYISVINTCLGEKSVDGILVIFTEQGAAQPQELAEAIAVIDDNAYKPIITVWMGGADAHKGRKVFFENNIPTYETPEEAVQIYLYMCNYERNLQLLFETPTDVSVDQAPPKTTLKAMVRKAIASGRKVLTEEESKRFLINYRIPAVKTHIAADIDQAVAIARAEGYPLVMKIVSPEISYKSDVGGVVLGIDSEDKLREEYAKLIERVRGYCSSCTITGVTLQKMMEKIDHEIILGARKDEDFGSVILFGMGGIGVQVYRDFSIGLPPLNQALARKLMEETRVYRMLQGYRGKSPVDLQKLEEIIISFSNIISDFPEILEMDINPIALSGNKAIALDARIILDPDYRDTDRPHLIISPYPTKYITHWLAPDGTDILLRPIRPEDEPLEHQLLSSLSAESLKERFFQTIKNISHEMHVRFCNIDYDREMAIVAEIKENDHKKIIGTSRLILEPDLKRGEFAVVIHDKYQGIGLGHKILDYVIGIGQEKGMEETYGFVLSSNRKMLNLCKKMGCTSEHLEDGITKVTLALG